jgi:hypothetical protein
VHVTNNIARRLAPAAAALCLGALAFAAPASWAANVTETATAGQVTAELSYKHKKFEFSDLHLRIVRAGQTLVDRDLAIAGLNYPVAPGGGGERRSVETLNIDRDGEPEVVVDVNSAGAHCCSIAHVFDYAPKTNTYALFKHNFADPGYRLIDPERDGSSEFRSADYRFGYVFTAFGFSRFPIQVWRYRNGTFRTITRRYPRRIRSDARRQLREYRGFKRRHEDVRGAIAAYVADEYLLGQGKKGWRFARAAVRRGEVKKFGGFDTWPAGRKYLRKLHRFLRRKGYIR